VVGFVALSLFRCWSAVGVVGWVWWSAAAWSARHLVRVPSGLLAV